MQNRSKISFPVIFADEGPTKISSYAKSVYDLPVYEVTFLHFHKYMEIGICLSGEGICYVEDTSFPFKAGDVQVVLPYQSHLSKNTENEPSKWSWVTLNIVDVLGKGGFANFDKVGEWLCGGIGIYGIIKREENPLIHSAVIKLLDDYFGKIQDSLIDERIAVDTMNLLIELMRASKSRERNSTVYGDHLIDIVPALALIRESLDRSQKPNVKALADSCLMSVSTFRRTFHKIMGVSPKEHISACMIGNAKKLLAATNLPVLEIAERSGYGNISCFNRSFRENMGMTPSCFRKSVRYKRQK